MSDALSNIWRHPFLISLKLILMVHDINNMVDDQLLLHLAWGPKRKVETWPIYFVNGFKFHTKEWSVNKKTINSGVCVQGDDEEHEHYYYGTLKEIMQLQYPGSDLNSISHKSEALCIKSDPSNAFAFTMFSMNSGKASEVLKLHKL
ncbi:uncharacterized protein LOC130710056 [Lotus japonicus]|uniref:uncharacterized protein LOC130710056 n=1 Tax=Lotus japonicus TaxID=34305 RepID=UPI00258557A0|nr:uncharacterized protein LOC130710056 [Lotus japonicus]